MHGRILIGIALWFCTACADKETSRYETISDFRNHLSAEDTYDSLLKKTGPPSKDIGSGIHIFVYPLKDSTEVWIGYTDKIVYARQVDKNGKMLEELLP